MGKPINRSRDDGAVVINLCQANAAPPLLPVFLLDVASEAGGVGSPFSVDLLTLSGLWMLGKAAVDPDGGIFSIPADERFVVKSSGSFGEGVGVSNVSGLFGVTAFGGVIKTSLKVLLVEEGSGCLVLLGTPDTRSTAGVFDVGDIKSCVCLSYLSIQGVNGDHLPVVVNATMQSVLGDGCVVPSEVVGALMEDRSVARFVKNGCLFKLKGELVC